MSTQLTFGEISEAWPAGDRDVVRDRAAKAVPRGARGRMVALLDDLRAVLDDSPQLRREFWRLAKERWRPLNPMPDGGAVKVALRQVREQVQDRIHAMVEGGVVSLDMDDDETGEVAITQGELVTLLRGMFPEDYPADAPPPDRAVDAPPGSPAKMAVMAARLAAGRALYHPDDPGMSSGGKRAKVVERRNGGGRRVLGWEDAPG